MRVSKNPEERKAELVQIASRLFMEQGFEHVKVSDIVREAGVAQGTYYYYFKTKQDVLVAVLESLIREFGGYLTTLARDTTMSHTKRFEKMMALILSPQKGEDKIIKLVDNASESSHSAMDYVRRKTILPIVRELVKSGIEVGEFNHLENAEAITVFMFEGITGQMHNFYMGKNENDRSAIIKGFEEACSIILGVERMAIYENIH